MTQEAARQVSDVSEAVDATPPQSQRSSRCKWKEDVLFLIYLEIRVRSGLSLPGIYVIWIMSFGQMFAIVCSDIGTFLWACKCSFCGCFAFAGHATLYILVEQRRCIAIAILHCLFGKSHMYISLGGGFKYFLMFTTIWRGFPV